MFHSFFSLHRISLEYFNFFLLYVLKMPHETHLTYFNRQYIIQSYKTVYVESNSSSGWKLTLSNQKTNVEILNDWEKWIIFVLDHYVTTCQSQQYHAKSINKKGNISLINFYWNISTTFYSKSHIRRVCEKSFKSANLARLSIDDYLLLRVTGNNFCWEIISACDCAHSPPFLTQIWYIDQIFKTSFT